MSAPNSIDPFLKPIPVDELPVDLNPTAGHFVFADPTGKAKTSPLENIFNKINEGITGTATPSSSPNPPGKFQRWAVYQAGTYTNFKDAANNPIVVTPDDVKNNFVYITVDAAGIASKDMQPQKDSKINTWEAKPFDKGAQVFNGAAIYEAMIDTLATDVPGTAPHTTWLPILEGFASDVGDSHIVFTTKDGSELFRIDSDGNLWASYAPNAIRQESVLNLVSDIKSLYEGAFKKQNTVDLIELLTKDESISISQDVDGSVYIPKLRIDELEYNAAKPVVSKNVFKGLFYDLPETSQIKLNFSVVFPVDAGVINRGTVDFMLGEVTLLTANCEISVQGNYSASASVPKKGFTIDIFNSEWKKLKIKIGKLPALDSYHLKAYWTDANRCKDLFNFRLWRQLISNSPYPESLFKTLNPTISLSQEQAINSAEAPFILDGIPSTVFNQGTFMGCYVLRMKKHATVFALDTKNQNHIHLDSQMYNCALGAKPYASYEEIAVDYEVRSPKSPNATAKANIVRFFGYMKDVYNSEKTFSGTHQDYLVLNRWIDFYLQCELIGHWDSIINNAMYITYDGTHWMPVLIDTDFTLGVAETPFGKVAPAPTGANSYYVGLKDIFPKFRAQLLPEIKARYAQIRDTTLSMNNMTNLLNSIISSWSRSDAEADISKWGIVTLPEAIESSDNIIKFLYDRKTLFLDAKYL